MTLWRRPSLVVLDLRPLQCGYANRGIGRCTRELAPRLAALLERPVTRFVGKAPKVRYQVFSLVLNGKENPFPNIPVLISDPAWKRPWIWDQVCLPFLLLRHRVAFLQNFVAMGPLPQISFPALFRSRGIAEIHDWHMFSENAVDLERFYRNTFRIRIQKKMLPKIRNIFVHSEQVRLDSIRHGVPAEKIILAPLGSDHFDKVTAEPWLPENFVLSIGDAPNKNLSFTLGILETLRSRFLHLNWIIVGDRNRVKEQLSLTNVDLPAWITVLVAPTDGLLKSCYQKALALVFPSSQEGFGIPLLEAMRLGCPILTTDIEPMKSILDPVPGLLPLEKPESWCKSLTELLRNPQIRKAAIEAGRKKSDDYTWDKTTECLFKVYP